MSHEENKSIVRRFFQLYDAGQLDTIEKEIIDSNAVIHLSGMPDPLNREAFKQSGLIFHAAFPDHRTVIEDEIADGDKVVTRSTFFGTHQNELQGIPPTGRQVSFTQVNIYRLVNAKIVEVWAVFDQFGLMQQLGVIPAQASASPERDA
jgi:predicted ester cyclase